MEPTPSAADRELLVAYIAGNAEAFSILAQRTSGMVHATCLRVLGDAQLAQDATQETFLQLMRNAHSVTGCVGAWLHRVATNKSLDLARSEARLHRRNQAAGQMVEIQSWNDLSGLVDEALEASPEESRTLLVRHFLEGVSQEALARELQLSQATVSRQLSEALMSIRERLRHLGVIASVSMLDQGWALGRQLAVPHAVTSELGKMALLKPVAVAGGGLSMGYLAMMGLTIMVMVVAIAGAVGAKGVSQLHTSSPAAPPALTVTAPAITNQSGIAVMPNVPLVASPEEHIDQALMTRAVTAVCMGDATTLRQLLQQHPALVRARVESEVGNYSGYFHHATLLHHVAGNPLPEKIPDNVVEIAQILLQAGAVVDAHTDAGPKQPTDPGWTTLGLVVSCGPAMTPHLDALVDVLVKFGANVDDGNGAALGGALQYSYWPGAMALVRHGARLDLLFAAGVGDVERVLSFFTSTGELRPGAVFLCGYPQLHGPTETQGGYAHGRQMAISTADQLSQALLFASTMSENPHRLQVATYLLEHGAKPRMTCYGNSALHAAAWINDQALCRLLLEHGADANAVDAQYQATPAGWADYNHHPECGQLIRTWKRDPTPPSTPTSGF